MKRLLDPFHTLGKRFNPVRDYVWTAGLTAIFMLFLSFALPPGFWMVFIAPLLVLNPALIKCHSLLKVMDAQAGSWQIVVGLFTLLVVALVAMMLDGQLTHVPSPFLQS